MNPFKKIFGSVVNFIAIFFGFRNTQRIEELIDIEKENSKSLLLEISNNRKELFEQAEAFVGQLNLLTQILNETYQLHSTILQRPLVPIFYTSKGKFVNLAIEKKAGFEAEYLPEHEILKFKFIIDYSKIFDELYVNLHDICTKNTEADMPQKPVYDLARVLLRKREPGLIDKICAKVMARVLVQAQHKVVDHRSLFYLCAESIYDTVKPIYDIEKADEEAKISKKASDETINKPELTGSGIDGEPREKLTVVPEEELRGDAQNETANIENNDCSKDDSEFNKAASEQ